MLAFDQYPLDPGHGSLVITARPVNPLKPAKNLKTSGDAVPLTILHDPSTKRLSRKMLRSVALVWAARRWGVEAARFFLDDEPGIA